MRPVCYRTRVWWPGIFSNLFEMNTNNKKNLNLMTLAYDCFVRHVGMLLFFGANSWFSYKDFFETSNAI